MTISTTELQQAKQDFERRELMPPLADGLNACVRWRWSDLDQAIDRQLAMLEDMEFASIDD